MTESQIIIKVKKNNREAQQLLFQKYKTPWYTICLRYNPDEQDAMDVLQNALVKIYTKINQFDATKGSFSAWSAKILVNENLMFLRKKKTSFRTDNIDNNDTIPYHMESAIDILSAKELIKMIQQLPLGYRAVFNLYVIEGYSHKEIAEKLKINIGTSKSQLFKAKKLLQQKLEVLL